MVSNLPYCISTDLLISLLELPWPVERMVLTVQEEFADRLLARPGSRDYSPLTVLLGAQARVEPLRRLPPAVFWPVPRVNSTVLRILPDAERRGRIADYGRFKALVAALFSQRRKTAAAALRAMLRPRLPVDEVASALKDAGVGPLVRADALGVSQIVALANRLARPRTDREGQQGDDGRA